MENREQFGSRIGFILVSAGCAIGIGNVWKFPYLAGANGGAAFILIYLVFLLILGIPIMACEFATFGIPMITSDIDVCHEVFEDFANVGFIRNDLKDADLDAVYATLKVTPEEVNGKYSLDETVMKEIELYKRFYK